MQTQPDTLGDLVDLVVTAVIDAVERDIGPFPSHSPFHNRIVLRMLAATTLAEHGYSASVLEARLGPALTEAIQTARQCAPTREMRVR